MKGVSVVSVPIIERAVSWAYSQLGDLELFLMERRWGREPPRFTECGAQGCSGEAVSGYELCPAHLNEVWQ